ncbi:hypothetical protein Hanom_Chr17g01563331 [Helianthus anomalus]
MCSPELKRANPKQSRTLQTRVSRPEIHYHTIALNLTTLAQFRYFLLHNHIFLIYLTTTHLKLLQDATPTLGPFHV